MNQTIFRQVVKKEIVNVLSKRRCSKMFTTPVAFAHTSSSSASRTFKTISSRKSDPEDRASTASPGSVAFAECETTAISDLFYQFARNCDEHGNEGDGEHYLTPGDVRDLLSNIGERPDERTLKQLFEAADTAQNGKLSLSEFLVASDAVLGGAPARIVIIVGGPGSGKGKLCERLVKECGVVHLSSGNLLRSEVESGTPLGKEVAEIMRRGELVSSAVITTLIRRHTRNFPGKRVLLDGFPRSVENAADFLDLMGTPELALHLDCDDTILMERIMKRGQKGDQQGNVRLDDNFETALQRLRTFHKYHKPTMDWLREQHVPVVNLDCSGTPQNVWNQLLAIGRLMRPTMRRTSAKAGNTSTDGIENTTNNNTIKFLHDYDTMERENDCVFEDAQSHR